MWEQAYVTTQRFVIYFVIINTYTRSARAAAVTQVPRNLTRVRRVSQQTVTYVT